MTPAFNVAASYAGAPGTATSTATEYQYVVSDCLVRAGLTPSTFRSLATFLFVWNGVFTVRCHLPSYSLQSPTLVCLQIIFLASLRTNFCLAIVFFGVMMGVWCLAGMYVQLAEVAIDAGKGSMSMALSLSKVRSQSPHRKFVALTRRLQAGGAFLFLSACSGFYLVVVQVRAPHSSHVSVRTNRDLAALRVG
mgnify:FL=1